MIKNRIIAIVGIGPRGLHALENLVIFLNKTESLKQLEILLFEESMNVGNGPVYEIHQTNANWINITERILHLEARPAINIEGLPIPTFPSFHEWIKKDYSKISEEAPDVYPPRNYVGTYLNERFISLYEPLKEKKIISLHHQRVNEVDMQDEKIILTTLKNKKFKVDEVLLTIGHQPTKASDQVKEWRIFVEENKQFRFFEEPYPLREILQSEKLQPKTSVALRGFGLAMIDVVRAIAEKFGSFEIKNEAEQELRYTTKHEIKDLLVPFSLDGLPPAPKPLNAKIDKHYTPTNEELQAFIDILSDKQQQKNASSISFIIDAIIPIASRVFLELSSDYGKSDHSQQEIEEIIKAWLFDAETQHALIVPREQSVIRTWQEFVDMALGKSASSLDYCIGQVWRHCQPSIYKSLSHNECDEEVFADIIALDERMKRYAYGPPLESIQQMLALVEAGVLNLSVVEDPKIELSPKGWILSVDEASITAQIMINTVLPSPQLKVVNSPIVQSLLSNNLIQPVHDDLGVNTDDDAYVISKDKNKKLPIALLGRLAKGTIIGVDAILECFGDRTILWAAKAAKRHTASLEGERIF